MTLYAGDMLRNRRYTIISTLGQGGSGIVYKVGEITFNRYLAIKELDTSSIKDPQELLQAGQDFKKEVHTLASLSHQHLPRIYDYFEENGKYYFVMDYIEGETLEDYLNRSPNKALPINEALQIGLQLCTVLHYLHSRALPIIFRDLKPQNIMRTKDGHIYLIDFGIARFFKSGQQKDTTNVGTHGYAAPEQYRGLSSTKSDVYSLGATLHQLLSGHDPSDHPFHFALLNLQEYADLGNLIAKMLDRDPVHRPSSMDDIKRQLIDILDHPRTLHRGEEKLSPVLVVSDYDDEIKTYKLDDFQTEQILIGRYDPSNPPQIPIKADYVSRNLLTIVREKQGYVLNYASSENGVLYLGKPFEKGPFLGRKLLKHGDVFSIGEYTLTLTYLTIDTNDQSKLSVPQIKPIPLNKDEVRLGRDPKSNTNCLDHPSVSSQHVRIRKQGSDHYVADKGSCNGVYVNNNDILSNERKLSPGDRIRVGRFTFIYTRKYLVQYDEVGDITITACGLERGTDGKLDKIFLAIPPRKFVAIVGGSGTGKSTLLKALNGEQPAQRGIVLYNGHDYYKFIARFQPYIGYVPQRDLLHENLTVRDALYYSARLRFPSYYTREMISNRIDEVLRQLHLTPAQINKDGRTKCIKDLSGGQRKRVSIALELLTRPKVLFLDEPTSGLDPGLDQQMMRLLRDLANKEGCTIVIVTHTTKGLALCDYACFLAEGGRLVYFGPPRNALGYFEKKIHKFKAGSKGRMSYSDIANVYEHLDSTEEPSRAEDAAKVFKLSREYSRYWNFLKSSQSIVPTYSSKGFRGNTFKDYWRQFLYLCARYLKLMFSSKVFSLPLLPILLLLQATIVGGLLLCFIGFGQFKGGFNSDSVLQCNITPQAARVLHIPDTSSATNPYVVVDCTQLKHTLEHSPQGELYAAKNGGVRHAFEQAIQPGPKFSPIVLFIMAFAAMMFGCVNAIREVVKESDIYKRERDVGVGILPYICSKLLILGILCLIQCTILVSIVSILDPFPHGTLLPGSIEIALTLTLSSWVGLVIGLTVSAIAKNSEVAMSLLPLLLLPQVVLSGVIFPLSNAALQTMGLIVPLRWSMGALGSTVGLFNGSDHLIGNTPVYQGTLYALYSRSDATRYLEQVWTCLIVMIVLYLGMTYGALLWKKRQRYSKPVSELLPIQSTAQSWCPECKQTVYSSRPVCQACGTQVI